MSAVIQIVLMAVAAGLAWLGWENIGILRGTALGWLHDLRLFLLLLYAFLVFSAAQWLAGLFGPKAEG